MLNDKLQNNPKLSIAPMQWSRLKDIDEIEPVNGKDFSCLAEIRDVLRKYGMIERFGVALLHSHFFVAPDEVMLETSDSRNRTLTMKPVKETEAGENDVGTIWMLREGELEAMAWCRTYCQRLLLGHESGAHTREG